MFLSKCLLRSDFAYLHSEGRVFAEYEIPASRWALGQRRASSTSTGVASGIHERKRISRGVPPDVCHAHKANARVTSINAAAARQLAIMKYARSVPPSSALNNAIADRSGFDTRGPKTSGEKKKKGYCAREVSCQYDLRTGLRAFGRVATSRRWAQAVPHLAGALGAP